MIPWPACAEAPRRDPPTATCRRRYRPGTPGSLLPPRVRELVARESRWRESGSDPRPMLMEVLCLVLLGLEPVAYLIAFHTLMGQLLDLGRGKHEALGLVPVHIPTDDDEVCEEVIQLAAE